VLDDRTLLSLVLAPGFSTAAAVTDISGRGVGMDVVRRNIVALAAPSCTQARPAQARRLGLASAEIAAPI
jgi:two-component system, chemotaxis family, sensor kinase CheA